MRVERQTEEPGFKPITIIITIESEIEKSAIKEMACLDSSIPELMRKRGHGQNVTDIVVSFLRRLHDNV